LLIAYWGLPNLQVINHDVLAASASVVRRTKPAYFVARDNKTFGLRGPHKRLKV
jgi:hypothetical protein